MQGVLSEYMRGLWEHDGRRLCEHCGKPIYYEVAGGYWIHAGHGKVDGHNGLFCSAAMWEDATLRKYARPEGSTQ